MDRLQRPCPRVRWSDAGWDAFGRHLNLYRADDDSAEGVMRRAGGAVADEYLGRYLQAHGNLPPLVPFKVNVKEPLFLAATDLSRAAQAATALLNQAGPGPGALYVAGHLLHQPFAPPIVVDVIVRRLAPARTHARRGCGARPR
jgi:hypothetical protein